ncbi:MAG TPA: hypothetical protein VG474_16515 [Solirubrobacteraceae bacterium]|nr:hypothetical protein [Solirubrobacteraceae bacterium]
MSYGNGSIGVCGCGEMAVDSCQRCATMLCDIHSRTLPDAPQGISPNALSRFEIAIRARGAYCESCRAELGSYALAQAIHAPRAPLPEHWLDRAIALNGDPTRSELEKLEDAALPSSLTPQEVAQEFLRRIGRPPQARVPVTPPSLLRAPDYVEGWSVNCRRTEYVAGGAAGARYPLPCLISTAGELLGPALEDGERHGQTWWVVPESDIELPRLVRAVARLLLLSRFAPKSAPAH